MLMAWTNDRDERRYPPTDGGASTVTSRLPFDSRTQTSVRLSSLKRAERPQGVCVFGVIVEEPLDTQAELLPTMRDL